MNLKDLPENIEVLEDGTLRVLSPEEVQAKRTLEEREAEDWIEGDYWSTSVDWDAYEGLDPVSIRNRQNRDLWLEQLDEEEGEVEV